VSFDYEKIKKKEGGNEQWASYSDLFMVLSMVFLLLYVTSSLRTGTQTIMQKVQNEELSSRTKDLENQLTVYEARKDEYMEKQASVTEKEVYEQLMDKLDLLQEENGQEASRLRKLAQENEEKEEALNQYQQIIRNIVNANVLSKVQIERKDEQIDIAKTTIDEQIKTIRNREKTISQKESEIENLDADLKEQYRVIDQKTQLIKQKQNELAKRQGKIEDLNNEIKIKKSIIQKNQNRMAKIETDLKSREKQLEKQRESQKLTQAQYVQQLKKVRQESTQKVKDIARRNKLIGQKLEETSKTAEQINQKLSSANQTIKQQEQLKQKLNQELMAKQDAMTKARSEYQENKTVLEQQISGLESEKTTLSKDLEKAQETINAKKKISKQIKENFRKKGIDAQVDARTGEVVLSFEDSFFDTGSSSLKKDMEKTLNEFMPTYSQSLLEDPEIAKKIKNVDIIGFASPTYRGKYVNPSSTAPEDKEAIQYNTSLSIKRAKAVFDHIIDTSKIKYDKQDKIQSLLKVSGRSFFSGALEGRAPAEEMTQREFCEKYNCEQEQKVIIRFELDD
jgi:chromosome segregation ATPase